MNLLIQGALHQGIPCDIQIENGVFSKIVPIGSVESSENHWGVPQAKKAGIRVIQAEGKAILPGFYNAHTHAAMSLMRGLADDKELFTWLQEYIWPFESNLLEEHIYDGTRLACLEMIRSGTVFFADMYWHHRAMLQAVEEMGLRVSVGQVFLDAFDSAQGQDHRTKAKALLADRHAFSSRVSFNIAPHAVYTVSREGLEWCRDFSAEHAIPLHIHVSETQKEVEDCQKAHGMSPVQWLDSLGCLHDRTVAAHLVHVSEEDLQILAKRQVTAVHNPVSNMKLCSGVFKMDRFLHYGIPVALGTDGCASNNNLNMLEEQKMASLLAKLHTSQPDFLSAQAVFDMATIGGAQAYGLPGGRIQTGAPGDCILVNLDHPSMVPGYHLISDMVYSAGSEVIDTVICDGRVLMENRIVPGEEEIIAKARETGHYLRNQMR
jgi:5-methylthioadenosine/S-adenosylhomocysteine deaminase